MKGMILTLTVAGALMLAGCGGGSKTGGPSAQTAGTTWEQLPTLIDRMDRRSQSRASDFPGTSCSDFTDCQAVVKSMVAAATEPTGTMRRFQGTRTVQTDGGVNVTGRFWGGWLDNSIFLAELLDRPEPTPDGRTRWGRRISMGIKDNNPVAAVYRGEAVDYGGNWGLSELNYTGDRSGGSLSLTINIPSHGDRGVMRWSNIPVGDGGSFDNGIRWADNVLGPNKLQGSFYQGGEVGGDFTYRWTSLARENAVLGVFGAKRTPASP